MKLEEYKERLISYYRYPADSNTYNKRKEYINSMYTDEKLKK